MLNVLAATHSKNTGVSATPMKRLIAVGLAVVVGFSAVCWKVLHDMQARDVELARVNAANLVSAIGSEITRNIEIYDLSLQAVVEGLHIPNFYLLPPDIRQNILFDRAATAHGLGSILVLNEHGDVTLDSRTTKPRTMNYAERDFFQVQKASSSSNEAVYISAPFITPEGEYVVGLSRRLNYEFGDFAGIVVGVIKLSYFYDLFRRPQKIQTTRSR